MSLIKSDNWVVNETPKILIVDDHTPNLLALEAILEPLGHMVVTAHSGLEALKHLLTHDFALILLDVQMPGMDGFETAALIKEREKSRYIPIIFVTAINTDERYIFQGYSAGAVDYLPKPFSPDILRSKVKVFVDIYLKNRQIQEQAHLLRLSAQREAESERATLEREIALRVQKEMSERQHSFLKDVLASVTEGRLCLCDTEEELPVRHRLFGEQISLAEKGALSALRHQAQAAAKRVKLSQDRCQDFVTAVSEAAMNAIVHAGGGIGDVSYDSKGVVQVRITDFGGGISLGNLPRATLERGFTTAGTLGHGFWLMLKTADRISLLTSSEGTTVVIEQDRDRLPFLWQDCVVPNGS